MKGLILLVLIGTFVCVLFWGRIKDEALRVEQAGWEACKAKLNNVIQRIDEAHTGEAR
jgi:hypothetical protein